MVRFVSEKISESVTRIHGIMDEQMYLVEGRERAVLIDTGTGVGSLKAYVESLTDKPVTVLITHGHLDHAMGAIEFDTVYMSRKDDYIYKPHGELAGRRLFLSESPVFRDVEEKDYLPAAPLEHYRDLEEGDVFDLGGMTIETFACPGHTLGSMVFLLREERTLLTGDACNMFTFLYGSYSTGLTTYEESLRELRIKVLGRFERICLSHGDSDAGKELLDEVIGVCEDIRMGRTDDIPYSHHTDTDGTRGLIAKAIDGNMRRIDGKSGNIVYDPDRIFE